MLKKHIQCKTGEKHKIISSRTHKTEQDPQNLGSLVDPKAYTILWPFVRKEYKFTNIKKK